MDFSKKVAITVALIIVIGGLIILFSKTSGTFMNGIWEWVFKEVFNTTPPKNPFSQEGTFNGMLMLTSQIAEASMTPAVVLA